MHDTEILKSLQAGLTELAQFAGIDPDGLDDSAVLRALRYKIEELRETGEDGVPYQDMQDSWNAEAQLRKNAERERDLLILAAIAPAWDGHLYVSIGARRMSNIPTQAAAIAQVKRYAGIDNDGT